MAQYVYTMSRVGKVVPPQRWILKDISLSFFPGAKIGVLGLNGAGKSTLLRIMAGLDSEHEGEARPQPGLRVGYLSQEPQLDAGKDVRGNVEDGVRETKALLERFNEVSMRFSEPLDEDEMNALLEEQGRLQDAIDASGGSPRTPCACRRGRRMLPPSPEGSGVAWRCAACCSRPPTCCCWMSPPTTSTPSR
jgi:sulfate-transporting ATPase